MNKVDNDTLAEEGGRCRHHGSHCVLTCFNVVGFYCCVDHFLADRFIETKQSVFWPALMLLWSTVLIPDLAFTVSGASFCKDVVTVLLLWLWEIQTASPVGRIQNSVCKYRTAGKINDWGCKNTITGCDMWGGLWPSSVVSSLVLYLCGSPFTTLIYLDSTFSQVWTRLLWTHCPHPAL